MKLIGLALSLLSAVGWANEIPQPPHQKFQVAEKSYGFWFESQDDFYITSLYVDTDNYNLSQTAQIIKFSEPPLLFPFATEGTSLFWKHDNGEPDVCVNQPIAISAGDIIGIVGGRYDKTQNHLIFDTSNVNDFTAPLFNNTYQFLSLVSQNEIIEGQQNYFSTTNKEMRRISVEVYKDDYHQSACFPPPPPPPTTTGSPSSTTTVGSSSTTTVGSSSTIGSSTIGSSTIGSSTIGSSTIGSSTIGSSTIGSSTIGSSSTVGSSSTIGSSSTVGSSVGSLTIGSSTVGSSTVGSSTTSSTTGFSSTGSTSTTGSSSHSGDDEDDGKTNLLPLLSLIGLFICCCLMCCTCLCCALIFFCFSSGIISTGSVLAGSGIFGLLNTKSEEADTGDFNPVEYGDL